MTSHEFTVKAKKARTDPGIAMGSQCRISPEKKVQAHTKNTVTTMTSMTSHTPDQAMNCHMTIDIPHFEYLWPEVLKVRNINSHVTVHSLVRCVACHAGHGGHCVLGVGLHLLLRAY